jgi:phospholipid/cholesterol/gamma-HCH transport system permease protein
MTIEGRLDSITVGNIWREATHSLDRAGAKSVAVHASGINYCDGSGIGLLFELRCKQHAAGREFEIRGLREDFATQLDGFEPAEFLEAEEEQPARMSFFEQVGAATLERISEIRTLIAFAGELFVALLGALIRPHKVRWKDAFVLAEKTGADALPIIVLLMFLIGFILAFQSAIPMRMFGAEVFAADLVAISLLRELGPLMTAIILAGRSGSAFAAELGTMKVNEELDALTTMGLDPLRFLGTTRVIAAVSMTPFLTVFANLCGLAGSALVMLMLGFPFVTYVNRVISAVDYVDLIGGLFKSVVFGLLVASIGCMRGLQTKTGASAVGDSTTMSVVEGITLIIVADGIFAVVFYYLGI